MKGKYLLGVAGVLLIFSSCGKVQSKESDSIPEETAQEEVRIPQDVFMELTGKVGKYPVEMKLVAQENGKVIGQYCYTKTGSHAWIAITGSSSDEFSSMKLIEKVDGNVTGTWELTVENPDSNPVVRGTMVNYKGTSYDVELTGVSKTEDKGSFNSEITVDLPDEYSFDVSDYDVSYGGRSESDDNFTAEDVNVDEALKAYEDYANQYINFIKRASNGDVSALAESSEILEKANDFYRKLGSLQGSMSPSQLAKLNSINTKILNSATSMQKDVSKASKAAAKAADALQNMDISDGDW